MTCGVIVPINRDLMEEVARDMLAWRCGDPACVADPRFATVIYRAALASGIMNYIAYEWRATPIGSTGPKWPKSR